MEEIEHAKFRALAQTLLDKEEGVKAFKDYMQRAFPYAEMAKQMEHAEQIKRLQSEIKRGALGVRPLWEVQSRIRSRLKAKHEQAAQAQSINHPKASSLYKRMGSIVPRR